MCQILGGTLNSAMLYGNPLTQQDLAKFQLEKLNSRRQEILNLHLMWH